MKITPQYQAEKIILNSEQEYSLYQIVSIYDMCKFEN